MHLVSIIGQPFEDNQAFFAGSRGGGGGGGARGGLGSGSGIGGQPLLSIVLLGFSVIFYVPSR
jgi:hypothetical protein